MSGTLTFTPVEAHLAAGLRLGYPAANKKRIAFFLAFGLAVGVALAAIDGFSSIKNSLWAIGAMLAWALFIMVVLIVGVRSIWLPRYAKRVFAQQRDLHGPVTIEWTDTHFFASAESGNTRMLWRDFYRWRRDDAILLLYRSEAIFNFIPCDTPEARAAATKIQHLVTAAGVMEKR